MTIIYLGAAWLIGLCLGALLPLPKEVLALAALVPLAALVLWRRDGRSAPISAPRSSVGAGRPQTQPRLVSACLLVAMLGALRYPLAPTFGAVDVAFYNGRGVVTVRGVVADEPDVGDQGTNLRLEASRLRDEAGWHDVRGTVLVYVPHYPAYRYGDELEVTGKLETPPEFADFSYRDYLARQDVYAQMRRPRVELVGSDRGNPFWTALYAFKQRAGSVIAALVPEPEASLLTGILLGVDRGIPADLRADFNRTSTSHIIAISGFNISIIAGMLIALATRLVGRNRAAPIAIAGVWAYTLLVGASASVVRAAIMGSLYVFATVLGRQAFALASLAVAAFVMTLVSPTMLWDAGFQLSFAATLGLVLFTPPLEAGFEQGLARFIENERAKSIVAMLNDALIVSLAAQITTLPIIVASFRQLSLVAPLANLLVLPAQPGVMLWGGLATIVGLVALPIAQPIAWVAWLFLTYTTRVVEFLASLPYAAIPVGSFGIELVGAYYLALFGALVVSQKPPEERKRLWSSLTSRLPTKAAVIALVLAAILVWIAVLSLPDGKLHVTFLDVGQGDAILVQTPQGQHILIDGGPSPSALLSALGRRMPFWERSLDLVILTHPHDDHVAGLVAALERYDVKQVVQPDATAKSPTFEQWSALLRQKQVLTQAAVAGMRLDLGGGLRGEVLYPLAGASNPENVNRASVVLRLSYGQVVFLLPGDIEADIEGELVHGGAPLASTVLKIAHHGSDTSSSAEFLQAVSPQIAVISVGADNRFGDPSPAVLDRLRSIERVYRTDQRGTVEVVTDRERVWVNTESGH
jgi:competence protein ComEC